MKNTGNIIGEKIPLVNLAHQYNLIKEEIDSAIKNVLESGWYILGREVSLFENEFGSFIGCKEAVGVASGTDALTLSIKALGLSSKDGVVVPANAYPSAFGAALAGVRIQLADVDPKTLNISLKTLQKSIKPNSKAVIVVHLYGNPVDLQPILKFTKKSGLKVIEDAAQAVGAEYRGKKVGALGDIGCFSFYPTKNLGGVGDGGMVTTNSPSLAKKIKSIRMYGESKRYKSRSIGHNSRLDELQAAVLRVKLKHLVEWTNRRREIAQKYFKQLSGLPIEFINIPESSTSVFHLFVIRLRARDKLMKFLDDKGIQTAVHYPSPIHLQKSFADLKHIKGNFPATEKSCREILSIPIYPEMDDRIVDRVISSIKAFFAS